MNVQFRAYYGPNIYAPFAAVSAEFISQFLDHLPASAIEAQWQLIQGTPLWNRHPPAEHISFADLIAALAVNLQDPNAEGNVDVVIVAAHDGEPTRILMSFLDVEATTHALCVAIEVAVAVFSKAFDQPDRLRELIRQLRAILRIREPHAETIRLMIRESRRRGIPVYPVAEDSQIWLFGQGSAGMHFTGAAGERDSLTGGRLAHNKIWANRLVTRLGFPGVVHALASGQAAALEIANRIGYPVVIKPIAGGKGSGVFARILDEHELIMAYVHAAILSPQGVIVERHVAGNDHRLAVFGGKLAWVVARTPAAVTGNGHQTVAQLIAEENERRKVASESTKYLVQIEVDEEMRGHLNKQGLSLDDQPEYGAVVSLRGVANISRGGTLTDCTDIIHPDNIEMAVSIARSFRMDAMGVDLITPDISRSWRDVPCAVIEVNETPGISLYSNAIKIIEGKFPAGRNGRIPSVLLIDPAQGSLERVVQAMRVYRQGVGFSDQQVTVLAGYSRCQAGTSLSGRVMALISDPTCNAIAIETTLVEVREYGLPLDNFDLIVSFDPLPERVGRLLASCCNELVEEAQATDFEINVLPALERVFQRYVPIG